jgi:pyruvate-formate lyase
LKNNPWSYGQRLDLLRTEKLRQTQEKQQLIGAMDHDDHGLILPPPDRRALVKTMSSSGMPIIDCRLANIPLQSNHPSGGFFGAKMVGANFRALLENHPVYIDPVSSLAGGYMTNFMSYRRPHWNPDYDYSYLKPGIEQYKLLPGIGATQHFCQDLEIGLKSGWRGILEKINHYWIQATAKANDQMNEETIQKNNFYEGLKDVVLGIQNWIERTATACLDLAEKETNPFYKKNLLELAAINNKLVNESPATFREACQWVLWYLMTARMYNGSGSMGRIDLLLEPYLITDEAQDILDEEEAIFHLACLLLRDTAYIQLGGLLPDGSDSTNRCSYLVLEATHRLKIPANVGVCVGDDVDPNLLQRGVEIIFEDKTGIPKFLGINQTAQGFSRNGYTLEKARERAYSGCHWSAIPGKEYTLNDCVKINLAAVFAYSLDEMLAGASSPSVQLLWEGYCRHLQQAVEITTECLDFHMQHMHQVFPELVLDLLCTGPIELGLDASQGGVPFTNLCIDGAGLAVVADSFAVIEQRIENENRMTWQELKQYLTHNWEGEKAEHARQMMLSTPRYGQGGTRADAWAMAISRMFTEAVKRKPTPDGYNLIPGLFSWANTIPMGKDVGATPNGRKAGAPISHGANPNPGFRKDGASTAMAIAIASVQPGWGNTAPMQLELDPMVTRDEEGVNNIASLIRTHFDLGGTQINLNILDAEKVLQAHQDPSKFPDLVVRVTGFSAYFASLSPEFRQLVVDRIISERLG